MSYSRQRFTSPWALDYADRARARRERQDKEFRERLRCAVSKAAVDAQGVGE